MVSENQPYILFFIVMPWIIVRFVETNEIEAIPLNWYNSKRESVVYPTFRRAQLEKAIKSEMHPEENWTEYKVALMRPDPIDNFITACAKASKACLTSDISDAEVLIPEKRQPIRRHLSSSEEESSEVLPNIPLSKQLRHPKMSEKLGREIHPMYKTQNASQQISSYSQNTQNSPETPKSTNTSDNSDTNMILTLLIRQKKILMDNELKMQDLNNKLDESNLLLRTILEKFNVESSYFPKNTESLNIFQDLPVNEDNFQAVEEQLKNPEVFQNLVADLSKLGGNNYKECTRRILKRVLEDQHFKSFSLYGHKGKQVFSDTKIFSAIRGAVHKIYSQNTLKEIESVIGVWLAKSSERLTKKVLAQGRKSLADERNTRAESNNNRIEENPIAGIDENLLN